MTRFTRMFLTFMFIVLILTGQSFALDKGSILGIWLLDEGSGDIAKDATGNGHDGLIVGSPEWIDGVVGTALRFNGNSSAVNCGNAPEFNTDVFSVSMWCNMATTTGWKHIMSRGQHNGGGNPGAVNWGFVTINPDIILFEVYNNTGWAGPRVSTVLGEWHHWVATYDAGAMALYQDGEQAGQSNGGILLDEERPFIIGAKSDVSGPSTFFDGSLDEVGYFGAVLTEEDVQEIMNDGLAKFAAATAASSPLPDAGQMDVSRDTMLSWTAGTSAHTHNLFFGTTFDDVNDADISNAMGVTVAQGLTDISFDPGRLDFDQTYYWRVDEVNSPANPGEYKGDVWSFTTEPYSYVVTPIAATASTAFLAMPPERTIDGSGLDAADQHGTAGPDMWLSDNGDPDPWIQYEFDRAYRLDKMWVWNSNQVVESFIGFGVKDATVEVSTDGVNWTTLADVAPFAQASGATGYSHNTVVDFAGHMAKFVKIDIDSNRGPMPQYGISEVRFFYIPVVAREPQPADGGSADSIDVTLGWRAGREAGLHEVLLSSDRTAVEDGSAQVASVPENSYTPAPLNYGTEYFWAINEVNDIETPSRHAGPVWSFFSPEYLVIDDFEMYTDEEFLEIWATWADGYQNDNNGALVGNGNTGETNVVYEGRQSMPIHYDNSGAAISEVTREFSPTLNWLKGVPTTLSLRVRGDAPALVQNADGSLIVGAAGEDIWGVEDDFRYVYKSLSGNGSITAKIDSFDASHDWAKAGVMIRESVSPESAFAMVCTTGTNGTRYQFRQQSFIQADAGPLDGAQETLPATPVWVKVERVGEEFNGYYATEDTNPNWVAMGNNPLAITMLDDVYIGLAVTSHDPANSAAATFANVTTTGSVSGAWTQEAIGGTHPENDSAPMYLVVKDAANKSKTITHPNPNVTVMTAWQEWQIPLSDLGLNLGSIQSITIGIGEPGGTASGEMGTAYVDLLQVGTPLP